MTDSQNGWPVLDDDSKYLYWWTAPATTGEVVIRLRRGPAGFILCHWLMWFAERIEPVAGKGDDFGWADRPIAGTDVPSNHWSGTACDLNASAHPSGARGTFPDAEAAMIRHRLTTAYPVLRWGGDFHSLVDEMHYEVAADRDATRSWAKALSSTLRGQRLLQANPTQGHYLL